MSDRFIATPQAGQQIANAYVGFDKVRLRGEQRFPFGKRVSKVTLFG